MVILLGGGVGGRESWLGGNVGGRGVVVGRGSWLGGSRGWVRRRAVTQPPKNLHSTPTSAKTPGCGVLSTLFMHSTPRLDNSGGSGALCRFWAGRCGRRRWRRPRPGARRRWCRRASPRAGAPPERTLPGPQRNRAPNPQRAKAPPRARGRESARAGGRGPPPREGPRGGGLVVAPGGTAVGTSCAIRGCDVVGYAGEVRSALCPHRALRGRSDELRNPGGAFQWGLLPILRSERGFAGPQASTRPRRMAYRVSWTRSCMPSFSRMLARWRSTVFSLITSASAICLVL
jgi:hypothetical protein